MHHTFHSPSRVVGVLGPQPTGACTRQDRGQNDPGGRRSRSTPMTITKKFTGVLAVGVVALGIAAPGASADHCTPAGPGHSYFGTEHVQEHEGREGGHKGFSSCNPSENNPSERSSGGKSRA